MVRSCANGVVALGLLCAWVAPPVRAEPKRFILPRSEHATLGQTACAQCHETQNRWWIDDAHYRAARRLLDRPPRALEIARKYGLTEAEMLRGDQVCMDCHGTIVSGSEGETVREGVSCESCHGAAEAWLKPHKERERERPASRDRAIYEKELGLGLRDLRDLAVTARTCTDCHYITDSGLLRATHVSGYAFPLADRFDKIDHWEHPTRPAGELAAAFDQARSARGFAREATAQVVLAPREARSASARRARRRTPRARPAATSQVVAMQAAGSVRLPPFPKLDGLTLERRIVELKARLELLAKLASGDS